MGNVVDPVQLRPLSIGEIFDRAVTLLVRNWAPLLSIAAVQVIPALGTYYAAETTGNFTLGVLSSIAGLVLGILATIATGAYVAALYRGNRISAAAALTIGARRLLAGLGAQLFIAIGAGIPLGLLTLLAIGSGVLRYGYVFSFGMAASALGIVAAWIFCIVLGGMLALTSIGITGCGILDSIGKAGSAFKGGRAGRSLLFGIALTLVTFGTSIAAGYLRELIANGTHSAIPGDALETIVAFISSPLADVVIAVFYFDVAIRREGYDLQVALDSMPAT